LRQSSAWSKLGLALWRFECSMQAFPSYYVTDSKPHLQDNTTMLWVSWVWTEQIESSRTILPISLSLEPLYILSTLRICPLLPFSFLRRTVEAWPAFGNSPLEPFLYEYPLFPFYHCTTTNLFQTGKLPHQPFYAIQFSDHSFTTGRLPGSTTHLDLLFRN
jgi:hypothetical protein